MILVFTPMQSIPTNYISGVIVSMLASSAVDFPLSMWL